jgi:alkylhydroperoxidase family enzyme
MDDFEHGPFTDAEKAVIAYADEVALTNAEGRMTPELFKRLRAHFSEADILEVGVTMAIISGMAKLSFVLDVVEKESYCPFAPSAAA